MNPYNFYIRQFAENIRTARKYSLGNSNFPKQKTKHPSSPVAFVFSPHPDDECIIGGFPLRLMRETALRVVNIPITYGSNVKRREARKKELSNACQYLGFDIKPIDDMGFEQITPNGRKQNPKNWLSAVNEVRILLHNFQPKIIFCPHKNDRHLTHCGTSLLVLDSLAQMPSDFSCFLVETEYWQPMKSPNLMVELDEKIVADLITALTFHVGEVQRNPYHLSLPAWLVDNVRRGSEILGSIGGISQDFVFACLYKVSFWKQGKLYSAYEGSKYISKNDNLISTIFEVSKQYSLAPLNII
jgi:LmbE family N-acetylglucosaminyl deacetylase